MCGIFGWSFKKKCKIPPAKRQALASVLSIGNSMRGEDSWGIYLVNGPGQKGDIYKDKGSICGIPTAQWGMRNVGMGHTRFATVGDKTKRNAHPFIAKDIILAHNGAIYNHKEMGEKYKIQYECDSEILAHFMGEKLALKELEGYGAMEWVEKETPESIFLARISFSGSLAIAKITHENEPVGVAWSSDKHHLKSALGAARMDGVLFEEGKTGEVFEARNGILWDTKRPALEVTGYRTYHGGSSYPFTGSSEKWERQNGKYFRSPSTYADDWDPGKWVRTDKGNGTVIYTPQKGSNVVGAVSGKDEKGSTGANGTGNSKDETKPVAPGEAIILQYPEGGKKDEHQYMGLKRAPNGDLVDEQGHVLDTDKASPSIDELEEEEYMRDWFRAQGYEVGPDGRPTIEKEAGSAS